MDLALFVRNLLRKRPRAFDVAWLGKAKVLKGELKGILFKESFFPAIKKLVLKEAKIKTSSYCDFEGASGVCI